MIAQPTVNSKTSENSCHLCGLPLGGSKISCPADGRTVHFCCTGCMYVFQILFSSPEGFPEDYKNSELYRACVSAGLIPSGAPDDASAAPGRGEAAGASPAQTLAAALRESRYSALPEISGIEEGLCRELSLRIEGMWCVACSWLIEQLLRKMDGVVSAGIYFFSDIARIRYMPHLVRPGQITDSISRLGYRATPVESGPESGESRGLGVRLGISAILCMNIMMVSFALYAGFFEEIGRDGAAFFSWVLWALATPVVFYGGWPILRRSFWSLRHRTPTMDVLISASVLSAYAYSMVAMFRGSIHVYFDTASTLLTLVLLGRFIELRAREKVSAGITALFHAANTKARLIRQGREVWTGADAVRPGDLFLVLGGERVPVDGLIRSPKAVLDESIITGESRPVQKMKGDRTPAGAVLLDADAEFEAERPGNESSLNQIIALIEEALSSKNNFELFADRAMRLLVPAVLALAIGTAAVLLIMSFPAHEALLRAMTVLVITCPCALGIATPLARVAAIARARASGILIRNSALFEKSEGLKEIILDKTGTLTEGKYVLREIETTSVPADEALRRVASAEAGSGHFLARETVRAARERSLELDEVLSFELVEGMGVAAVTASGDIIAGNRRILARFGLDLPAELDRKARAAEESGATVVFFAWSGSVRGLLVFSDKLRENAAETVRMLRRAGLNVRVVSGDSGETTRVVAHELGIADFTGQALPADKVEIIARLQAQGARVAMAGDGLNDAAALARADIGITVGQGANLIRECADAAVFGDDPLKIPELIAISRLTLKIIRQNLFFAFVYNMLGIPLAAAGLLNPLLAAFAMLVSSITVIGNTLRISRYHDKRTEEA